MAKNLADRLESLSGYRHVFPPNDPKANLNPIVFSHLRVTVGGKPYHILSRICAAGLDYTQRSNKFAHHVVLDQKELIPAGPAAVLAAPGFMESSWEGEPRTTGVGRQPPRMESPPAVCRHWERVTGDAGWAGILAQTAADGSSRVAAVIFQPGVDTLSLVAEALALLPAPLRWQVTFSTYFTTLPAEVQCQWRFVLKGSPEAKAIERSPHALSIDLTSQIGQAPDGPWVEAARTGQAPKPSIAEAKPISNVPTAPFVQPVGAVEAVALSEQSYDVDWESGQQDSKRELTMPRIPGARSSNTRRKSRRALALIIAGTIAAGLLVAVGIYQGVSFFRPRAIEEVAAAINSQRASSTRQDQRSSGEKNNKPSPNAGANKETHVTKDSGQKPDSNTPGSDQQAKGTAERNYPDASKKRSEPKPPAARKQAPATAAATSLFDLPHSFDYEQMRPHATGARPRSKIGNLQGAPADAYQIDLIGKATVFEDGWIFSMHRTKSSPKTLLVEIKVEEPMKRSVEGAPYGIASVFITNDELWFEWRSLTGATRDRAAQLNNSVLCITHGDKQQFVPLRAPVHVEPVRVSFRAEPNYVSIPLRNRPRAHADLQLTIPETARSSAQNLGYEVTPPGPSHAYNIRTSKKHMPSFALKLDPKNMSVELACNWQLLIDNKTGSFIPPDKMKERFEGQDKTLNDDLKVAKNGNDKIAIQARIDELATKLAAINDALKTLQGIPIPFSVIMTLGPQNLVLAETSLEPARPPQ